jgi:hypothetical protein
MFCRSTVSLASAFGRLGGFSINSEVINPRVLLAAPASLCVDQMFREPATALILPKGKSPPRWSDKGANSNAKC